MPWFKIKVWVEYEEQEKQIIASSLEAAEIDAYMALAALAIEHSRKAGSEVMELPNGPEGSVKLDELANGAFFQPTPEGRVFILLEGKGFRQSHPATDSEPLAFAVGRDGVRRSFPTDTFVFRATAADFAEDE